MPDLRILVSSSAAVRLDAARAFVAAAPAASGALIVGASQGAADDLARQVTASVGATFGIHRASLARLAAHVAAAELARAGVAPSSPLGGEALAARVAFEALETGALPYFEPVARFPGFARAAAATIGELRLGRVAPGAFAGHRGAAGSGADVAELLARFEAALQSGALADRRAILDLATQTLSGAAPPPIASLPLVLLDVPVHSAAELEFVRALVARAAGALASVAAGDERTLAGLEQIGGRREAEEAGGASGAGLAHLRSYLFSPAAPAAEAREGEAVFFSAPGEGREAVEIVRRVLEEAREGTPFDRMAILLRAPHLYASLLETALSRAGVPAYFTAGARRPDPAGRAFVALLECAIEKLSARRFAEYLSLGQVPALADDGSPPRDRDLWVPADDEALTLGQVPPEPLEPPATETAADEADTSPVVAGTLRAPWKWERLLVDSAVIGGHERWQRRVAGLGDELRVRIEELREEEPESPRAAALERDLANLEHLERFALPVIERLAALPATATWGEWIAELEGLAPMVLRRPERVLALLAQLRGLGPIGPVSLQEVRDVLGDELATVAERPPASRYGRVFVGPLEQARGRLFDVVFVPGLAERVFPQKLREDPILLDTLRGELGADLAVQNDRARQERLLLRLGVGAAARRVYLSYSRIEVSEARPRVPSFYAMEVQRALAGRIPDPQTLERAAADAGQARLAWPAPDDASRAIDEIEHDLANLHALLHRPAAEARGRGRYLLDLNDRLARSLRTRWARWRQSFTPADGLVRLADGTREVLLASRPSARAYSVSALQRFAVCPYQFYLSAICRLTPRDEIAPLERLDPATRGHLFHRVQAEAFRALQAAGRLPLSATRLPEALELLDRTLDRVADEYREKLAPAIARVWQDEIESIRVDLRTWLDRSVEGQSMWEPFAFELSFGLPIAADLDARSTRDEVTLDGGWRLRGIVDLVERRRAGGDLRVTDHKTGINRTTAGLVVGRGEALQPVLYGLAVERLFGQHVVESRLSYCTRTGEFAERVVPMTDASRQRGLQVVETIDRALARGFLPPAPRDRACGMCDFRPVCGPMEELRASKKDRRALEDLLALRSWP